MMSFLRGVKAEMKYIKWPTKRMIIMSTIAVILISTFVALYLDAVDMALRKLLTLIVK